MAIEQATASIVQTTRPLCDRPNDAGNALSGDPDNVDLAVSLAALQLRGI